jgi:hypothetical protein
MNRLLDYEDKEKIKVKINIPNNPFNGQIKKLNNKSTYYMMFIDKNRGGLDKVNIIYKVDKGKMIWQEIGTAVFNNKSDEEEFLEKEAIE